MNLYQIPQEAREIESQLEEASGELSVPLLEKLEAFLAGGADRLEAAACVVRSLQAQQLACTQEIDRLSARRQGALNSILRLQALMLDALEAMGGKLKTPLFTLWSQRAADTLLVGIEEGFDLQELEHTTFVKRAPLELDRQEVLRYHDAQGKLPRGLVIQTRPGATFLRIK